MPTTPTEENELPPEVFHAAEAMIGEALVMRVEEFDERVLTMLGDHFTPAELNAPMVRNGKPSKRSRGLNLVDWVKAIMTRRERTVYVGGEFIVWLPAVGNVDGKGLAHYSAARAALVALHREATPAR